MNCCYFFLVFVFVFVVFVLVFVDLGILYVGDYGNMLWYL